jgi:hypothetical protein
MPDYSKGKIYKIVCNKTGKIYIGSTCELLCQRLAKHRSQYKSFISGTKGYITSFDIIKDNDYDIILIEDVNAENKEQLHRAERKWIDITVCVNKNKPLQTKKEWHDLNKDDKKIYDKQYRELHKDKKKEMDKVYYENNKAKKKENTKKWRDKQKSDSALKLL